MPTLTTRSGCRGRGPEPVGADVGQDDGDARVALEQVPRDASTKRSRMPVTTARRPRRPPCGRPRCRPRSARSSASGSRPSTVVASTSPRPANRAAMPPGQPCVADALSTTITVRASSPTRPANAIASWFDALVELAVADQAEDARPGTALGAQAERHADGQRQAVAERAGGDLDARHQVAGRGGGRAASRTRRSRPATPRGRTRGREHRVVRLRPVALREQEPVAVGRPRSAGRSAARARRGPSSTSNVERALGSCFSSPLEPGEKGRQPAAESRQACACRRRTSSTLEVKWSGLQADHRRAGRAQRRRDLRPALLGGQGLIAAQRTDGNQRRYRGHAAPRRADPGRQRAGVPLRRIGEALGHAAARPHARRRRLDTAVARLARRPGRQDRRAEALRDDLTGCIGCGCLSLRSCRLFNPGDRLAEQGPGPRNLLR